MAFPNLTGYGCTFLESVGIESYAKISYQNNVYLIIFSKFVDKSVCKST